MKYIVIGCMLSLLSIIGYGQNVFYINKGDSSIVITTGESKYFYNIIREIIDSSLFEMTNKNHDLIKDTIIVTSSFNDEKGGWNVEWRVKRDSFLIQKGFFGITAKAEGEFNCFHHMDSSKCFYIGGIKEGTEFFYAWNQFHVRQYKNGWRDGICYVIENNKFIKYITEYKNGKRHGMDIAFWISDNNVSIHYSDIYINGVIKDGRSFVYHPDGSIFAETNHKNGLQHGMQIIYGGRGTLLRKEKYRNGKLIKFYKIDYH